jgi:cellulose biosynthesis protein BcsQ
MGTDGELWVLPSNVETRLIPMAVDDTRLLHDRLVDLEGWADTVIVDTSPTPSLLHGMIYLATTHMIYPTTCELLSMEGLAKSVGRLDVLNKNKAISGLPPAQLLGIQPTMYDVRTNAHDWGLGLVVNQFKRKAWPAFPTRTIWRDASAARQTIMAYPTQDKRAKGEVLEQVGAFADRVVKGLQV